MSTLPHQRQIVSRLTNYWVDLAQFLEKTREEYYRQLVTHPVPLPTDSVASARIDGMPQAAWQKWEDEAQDSLRWEFLWAQQQQLGIPALGERVQALWARLGVDWERLIVTELSLAYHRGLLAAVKPGTRGYIPPIGDAKVCRACHRLLEGRWFRLYPQVPPNLTAEDWQTALWPTKSNVGRKAADWIPCVPLHPHCRHLVILGPGERLARKKGSTHG